MKNKFKLTEEERRYHREYQRKRNAKLRDQKNREKMVDEVLNSLKKAILAA